MVSSRTGLQVIPLKTKQDDKASFAGDYVLRNIFLHSHVNEKLDISAITLELNIYESIYKNAMTGSIVIGDTQNQIARMQIQGLERISFKLTTPGQTSIAHRIDATEETGDPFHVYKITNRKQENPGLTIFTLHFASREFMRNIRTKISQSFTGTLDDQVRRIMSDKDYLDSRKTFYVQPTSNQDKTVVSNKRPFDAISDIAKRSIPEDSKDAVGYYFYETSKGYYFRSWQSMVAASGQFKRSIVEDYYYQPAKATEEQEVDKIEHDLQTVEEYEFTNTFHDVAANTALGTYGHRVISYNFFDKSITESDYHYHNEFTKTRHADSTTSQFDGERYAIADTPVDFDNKKSVSDYAESRVSLQGTTQFAHNEGTGMYGIDVKQDSKKTGAYQAQYNQVLHGTTIRMRVKGQARIQAGDLINFHMKDPNADRDKSSNDTNRDDPRFSGRYVITKLRHQITGDDHKMILEITKDSVGQSIAAGVSPRRTSNSLFNSMVVDDPYGGNDSI